MRALLTLIVIAVAVGVAVMIADQPGHVAIEWQDWRLNPSVPVLIATIVVLAAAAMLVLGVLRRVIAGPGAFLRARRERRQRAGYRALTQGMVAVAAGDAEEAQRHARKADVLLAEPPLTLLLSAQAAQLNGDEDAARHYFSQMLTRAETEFLGLRGLLTQALRKGDDATARQLAERAHRLRPKTPWVLTHLLELHVRSGAWDAAHEVLTTALKRKLVAGELGRHHQAVLLHERSRVAEAKGQDSEALALTAKALDLAPDFAPAAALRGRLLRRAGRDRPAAKAIETAWRRAPHPLLAEAYAELNAGEPPLARVKRAEKLAAVNPDHVESHIVVAEAALAAQLWGEARRHLQAARGNGAADPAAATEAASPLPSARICRLMAELEERQHGDGTASRAWLARAAEAPPDPVYVCRNCAAESLAWRPVCARCRGFDTLDWRTPSHATAALPAPSPDDLVGAPGAAQLAPPAYHAASPPPTPVDAGRS
jgi:HemY protein